MKYLKATTGPHRKDASLAFVEEHLLLEYSGFSLSSDGDAMGKTCFYLAYMLWNQSLWDFFLKHPLERKQYTIQVRQLRDILCEICVFTLWIRLLFFCFEHGSISSFLCARVSAAQRDLLGNQTSFRNSEKERFQSGILSWYLPGYMYLTCMLNCELVN